MAMELVEYIAKSIVDKPDEVTVTEVEAEGRMILKLQVASEDMGKVIGKQGRVARAIRTLLRVLSAREGRHVVLEIG